MTKQVGKLIDIDNSVVSVRAAINHLRNIIAHNQGGSAGNNTSNRREAGGMIPAHAGGGIIGNGLWNRDSVTARFAGGGDVMLAGGEFVARATSVTPATLPVLNYINRTGAAPANDNGAYFEALGNTLTRALAATTTAQITAMREEIRDLKSEVRRLGDTTRIEARRPQRPGKVNAA